MQTMWQRFRTDEHAIKYVIFAVAIAAWLLLTGGMNSTPAWIAVSVNGAFAFVAFCLALRAYLRVRRRT